MQLEETVSQWVARLGMHPTADSWTTEFILSTVPMSHWFYKRNKLRPEDVKLSLTAPSWGRWIVNLSRHDKEYQVQWRPGGNVQVEAQQLRYRKLVKWPALEQIDDFPKLAAEIEAALGIKFITHVNVAARFIKLDTPPFDDRALRDWLAPCADSWGQHMRDAGEGPADDDFDDDQT